MEAFILKGVLHFRFEVAEFTDIVHELRGHIGALRKAGAPIQQ